MARISARLNTRRSIARRLLKSAPRRPVAAGVAESDARQQVDTALAQVQTQPFIVDGIVLLGAGWLGGWLAVFFQGRRRLLGVVDSWIVPPASSVDDEKS